MRVRIFATHYICIHTHTNVSAFVCLFVNTPVHGWNWASMWCSPQNFICTIVQFVVQPRLRKIGIIRRIQVRILYHRFDLVLVLSLCQIGTVVLIKTVDFKYRSCFSFLLIRADIAMTSLRPFCLSPPVPSPFLSWMNSCIT